MANAFNFVRIENKTGESARAPIKTDTSVTVTDGGGHAKSPSANIVSSKYEDLFTTDGLTRVKSFQVDKLHVNGSTLPDVPWDPIPKLPTGATCINEIHLDVTQSGGSFVAKATYTYDSNTQDSATSVSF